MTRTRSQFLFNTHDALTLGVDAAILWALIRDLTLLSENGTTITTSESRWLEWLPFFSPAQFMNALETLCDAGKVIRHPSENAGEITLSLRSDGHSDPHQPPAGDHQIENLSPPATTERPTTRKAPKTTESDWADFDMPPPMPTMSPLLTDNTLMMEQNAATRRRYVNEPLYQMGREQSADTETPESEPNTTDSGPRQSTRMTLDWQPSEDCLNLVHNKGISSEFAMAQRESFVLYYRDSGQRQLSWDTKFFNWVCRRWQYHLNDQSHDLQTNANNPADARSRKQKLRAKLRDIGDLDW